MRYFTEKLWREFNSLDPKIVSTVDEAWAQNMRAYEAQLESLIPRMGKRNRRFWSDYVYRLHDGYVVRIAVGDALAADVVCKRPRSWRSGAIIEIVGWDGFLYTLKYMAIEALDMCLRDGGDPSAGTLFEQWGYSELTAEHDAAFRHSILFASGGEVSIVFNRFSYQRAKLPKI